MTDERPRDALLRGAPIAGITDLPPDLSAIFVAAIAASPERTLTLLEGAVPERWTYAELHDRSARVAGGLGSLGLSPGDRVVLLLDRAQEVLPAFWGAVLGGFVPLIMEVPASFDPDNRAFGQLRRVWDMLGSPTILCRQEDLAGAQALASPDGGEIPVRVASLHSLAESLPLAETHHAAADDLAFLCSSSGSTGTPKCIMLTHRCVIARNAGTNQHNDHRGDDVNLGWLPFDHIGSVTEHIRSLMLGCEFVYVDKDRVLEKPTRLLDIIDRYRVTHTWGPNFVYALIAEALGENEQVWDLSCVRFLISGGEPPSFEAMRRFLDQTGRFGFPATGFRPSFGMVELTAGVTYFAPTIDEPLGFVWLARAGIYGERVERVAADYPNAKAYARLGLPIAGCAVRVVDRDGSVVPEGIVGRVQFGGAPLAAGYFNNPKLSEKVFQADGWLETEDLGLLVDGELVLTGRLKEMLVIRGVNYYSRELEDIVDSLAGVERSFTAACAVHPEDGEALAIFFAPEDEDATEAGLGDLLQRIRATLVQRARANPSVIVPLTREAIPKTPIGKIQRLELARRFDRGDYAAALRRAEKAIERTRASSGTLDEPRDEIEAKIAEVWREVLGVDLGIHDNFFALGGDSIKAASVVHGLAAQGLSGLRPASLFDAPTIAELAKLAVALGLAADGRGASSPLAAFAITPDLTNRGAPFPLTDIQQAYWAGRNRSFELGGRSVHSYTELESYELDVARLELAWRRMVERHEMLRTVIDDDGTQRILPSVPPYTIEVEELAQRPPPVAKGRLKAIRRRMSHQVLACATWPTFEVRAARLPEGRTRLFLSLDALFLDARSNFILLAELRRLYEDPEADLPPLALSLRDYVLQERALKRSPLFDRAQEYWLGRLDDLPDPPELPLAVAPSSLRMPDFVELHRELDRDLWRRLVTRAARAQITPSCLLLGVFADALRPWSKSPRFTLNLTAYRRLPLHPQVNDIIGDFSTLLLVAIEAPEETDFITRTRSIQRELMLGLEHDTFSGVDVLRELGRRQGSPTRALAPVVFTSVLGDEMHDAEARPYAWLGEVVHSVTQTPQIWFDHIAFEEGGRLVCRWNVVKGLFPPGVIEGIFDAYLAQLTNLAADADDEGPTSTWRTPWSATHGRILPPAQLAGQRAINQTSAEIRPRLLHAAFLDQVGIRGDAPAVIAADRSLDYRTLSELAHQAAHRLLDHDFTPGSIVVVALEKGWRQVVAALAVLLSGAAYLPLDPGLPEARLRNILERSGAVAIVTSADLAPLMPIDASMPLVDLDSTSTRTATSAPVQPRQRPEDLAYVIYTSGSSGEPKGVMIDHRGAWNTIADVNERYAVGPEDRLLALSALTFDLSVYDIFGILAAGGAIVMPRPAEIREPRRWAQLIDTHRVTLWNTVPAFMGVLLDCVEGGREASLRSLRLVLLSGDWIPLTLPPKLAALPRPPQVVSLGGATEASIWSILHPLDPADTIGPQWGSVPYGRPMANQTFYVLDHALNVCPEWAPGQLYIGGIGVALGYLGDPERTAHGFIQHPRSGERLYRTGDLGRYRPGADGLPTIEFLGREDGQVKIQGFRVELGEIEAALARHPTVNTAVVIARGQRHADKQLVAYVVASEAKAALDEELQSHLATLLPAYMIPTCFVALGTLPLSANGKVDRGRLPPPPRASSAAARTSTHGQLRALGGILEPIAAVVAEVLELEEVAEDTNLFNLGATSIHLMRIVNRLERDLDLRVSADVLFDQPTILTIASAAKAAPGASKHALADPEASELTTPPDLLARFPAIHDPIERRDFTATEPGLRRLDGPAVALPSVAEPIAARIAELQRDRRSHRHFSSKPISLTALSGVLAALDRLDDAGQPKYLHASAGGLYPVQTYLYVKPGRVEGLEGGYYHLDRLSHRLVRTSPITSLDEHVYNAAINRPVWRRAALSIFLVADMSAIVPLYRESSLHFAVLEAGLIAQLLEMLAPTAGLGLVQMGQVDFDGLRPAFGLDEGDVLVHSLMAGAPLEGVLDGEATTQLRVEEEF